MVTSGGCGALCAFSSHVGHLDTVCETVWWCLQVWKNLSRKCTCPQSLVLRGKMSLEMTSEIKMLGDLGSLSVSVF